jgi:hypothetical protein
MSSMPVLVRHKPKNEDRARRCRDTMEEQN